ncbi:MAG: hypothetical protein IJY62_03505 [Clostridia bacterium]|nr:hypothetical protein [Clostridia bacterium]
MEIYNIYQTVLVFYMQRNKGLEALLGSYRPFIVAFSVAFGLIAALFFLQAAGLFIMAKKRNMSKKWLAFVPFANIWYIGKLAGTCEVFGHKMRRVGLYAMIAQIVDVLVCFSSIAAEVFLFVRHGDSAIVSDYVIEFMDLSGFANGLSKYYMISEYIYSITGLIYSVMLFILLMGLYRKYYAKGYMLLSWVAIFVPISRYIVIFVLRNNQAIDYNEYMRKKREAYARRYGNMGGYGGYRPYGGYGGAPYGNGQGGYGTQGGAPYGERPKPEEPFSEFGGASAGRPANGAGEPFSEFGGSTSGAEPFSDFAGGASASPNNNRTDSSAGSSSNRAAGGKEDGSDDLFD